MKPILFELDVPVLGEVVFPAYMTLLTVGFLVAITLVRRHGERAGMSGPHLVDLGVLMVALGLVGGRLLAVLTDGFLMDFVHLCTDPTQVPARDSQVPWCGAGVPCDFHYVCDLASHTCHPPRDCLAALKFWQGGLTFYGGLLLAVPGGLWFAHKKGLGALRTADLVAPFIMLGMFFGRLGCFLNGCCYGAATGSWVGVHMPGRPGPVHPTQLYEAAVALGLFAVLRFAIWPRRRGDGEVFAWLLVLYGLARVVLEVYRADPRGALGPLSTSQLLSVPLVAAGIYAIVATRRRAGGVQSSDRDTGNTPE